MDRCTHSNGCKDGRLQLTELCSELVTTLLLPARCHRSCLQKGNQKYLEPNSCKQSNGLRLLYLVITVKADVQIRKHAVAALCLMVLQWVDCGLYRAFATARAHVCSKVHAVCINTFQISLQMTDRFESHDRGPAIALQPMRTSPSSSARFSRLREAQSP